MDEENGFLRFKNLRFDVQLENYCIFAIEIEKNSIV
jgi:hypothetical protein